MIKKKNNVMLFFFFIHVEDEEKKKGIMRNIECIFEYVKEERE